MDILKKDLAGHPAWQQAWRLRCCPPDHLLVKPPNASLRDHLELCPWCREALELPPCPMPGSPPAQVSAAPSLAPGQIYALDPRLAGWGPKSRYYNPPAVLIVSCPDERSVFVCQIYGDTELAGPDDVALGHGVSGFAQPWNCYTLMRRDLGLYLGKIDAQIADRVRQHGEQGTFSPQPGSLLWFFRQMEVETGFFFSNQAIHSLLADHESDAVALVHTLDPAKVREYLHCLPLTLPATDRDVPSPLDLLVWAVADERILPLAAADEETIPALIFTLQQGRIVSVAIEPLTVSFQEYAEGMLTITGSTTSMAIDALTWVFRWQTEGQLIEPLPGQSGCDDQVFWATFPLTPEQAAQPGTMVVRILRVQQG
jgi:hypothetical protein